MTTIIVLIILVVVVPIIAVLVYTKIQTKKKVCIHKIDHLSEDIQCGIERCFKSVNGWLSLLMFSLSIYYIFNIWSVCFSLLTFFVVSYEATNFDTAISICAIMSLLSTALNLIVRPKELFQQSNDAWQKTSLLATNFKIDIMNKKESQIAELLKEFQQKLTQVSEGVKYI